MHCWAPMTLKGKKLIQKTSANIFKKEFGRLV
jgi:hypothetical protein